MGTAAAQGVVWHKVAVVRPPLVVGQTHGNNNVQAKTSQVRVRVVERCLVWLSTKFPGLVSCAIWMKCCEE